MTARRIAGLVALLVAAPAGAAHAAYAPQLDVRLDPSTPDAQAAVTITLRQQPGETASRTQVLRYPRDLRFNPAFSVAGCRPAEEEAQACPASSRIGAASAETEFGPVSGDVYLTEDFRTVIFVRGFAGLVQSKISGEMRVAADGTIETVLDNLPPVRSTFAQVRLEGGSRSLVLAPRRCGAYRVQGTFTSHEGEVATADASFAVSDCDSDPRIDALSARRRGRSIAVAWRGTADGRVQAVLERRTRKRPYERWRRVATAAAASRKGRNKLRLGAPPGTRLRPGLYRVTVRIASLRGRPMDTERTELLVRRR